MRRNVTEWATRRKDDIRLIAAALLLGLPLAMYVVSRNPTFRPTEVTTPTEVNVCVRIGQQEAYEAGIKPVHCTRVELD